MARKTRERAVQFELAAPGAASVALCGSFNDWEPGGLVLEPAGDGMWRVAVDLAPGVYEYRFIVDGQWQDDPACPECCPNPFGAQNSVLRV